MRFFTAAVALFASLALAQQNAINIPTGQSTLDIVAGQPQTITWTNPSSGTVTIKLQESGPNITPGSGIVLATAIPASAGTATFTIDPSKVNTFQYTIEIIDDTNPSNINFSPNFGIANASGTLTAGATASSTGSTTGSTATDSTPSITASASTTESSASESTGSTITDSSSNSDSSSTTSSATPTESTSAPSSDNVAAGLKVQGGLVALIAVAVAVL